MIERWAIAISLSALLGTGAMQSFAATDLGVTCPPSPESGTSASPSAIPAGLPEGIVVTALAACATQELPEGTEFTLAIERVVVYPTVETKTRKAAGPVLYWVEAGSITVVHSGEASTISPGESVLIERGDLVWLHNTASEPAQVLLVGLLPPEGELPITAANQTPYTWDPLPEEQGQIERERLLVNDAGPVAREETLLFAACLNWTDEAAEMAERSYPGPVGLWVLRGQAVVNGSEPLGQDGSLFLEGYDPLRVQAGDQAPAVLMFGALAASGLAASDPGSGEVAHGGAAPLACAGAGSESATA